MDGSGGCLLGAPKRDSPNGDARKMLVGPDTPRPSFRASGFDPKVSKGFGHKAPKDQTFSYSKLLTKGGGVPIFAAAFGWGRSSVGRAPQWHCGGLGFDPPRLHQPSSKAFCFVLPASCRRAGFPLCSACVNLQFVPGPLFFIPGVPLSMRIVLPGDRPPSAGLEMVVSFEGRNARPAGIEPATRCLEGNCSIQLSYGRNRAGTVNRVPRLTQVPIKYAAFWRRIDRDVLWAVSPRVRLLHRTASGPAGSV